MLALQILSINIAASMLVYGSINSFCSFINYTECPSETSRLFSLAPGETLPSKISWGTGFSSSTRCASLCNLHKCATFEYFPTGQCVTNLYSGFRSAIYKHLCKIDQNRYLIYVHCNADDLRVQQYINKVW